MSKATVRSAQGHGDPGWFRPEVGSRPASPTASFPHAEATLPNVPQLEFLDDQAFLSPRCRTPPQPGRRHPQPCGLGGRVNRHLRSGASTVHELDITYFGAGTISDLVVTGSPFTSASVVGGDIVEIKFATTSSAMFNMTFDSDQDQGLVLGGGYHRRFTYTAFHTGGTPSSSITLNASSVPEPTSIAMLGIGMAGLVAFRRIRNSGMLRPDLDGIRRSSRWMVALNPSGSPAVARRLPRSAATTTVTPSLQGYPKGRRGPDERGRVRDGRSGSPGPCPGRSRSLRRRADSPFDLHLHGKLPGYGAGGGFRE